MSAKAIKELTPEQMKRAIQANFLQLFGCHAAAKVIVDGLRKESGVRPNYGSFRFTEMDEGELESVETPKR